ncbi:MAG: Zn-dependent hydrolase, partial [Bacteroidales bacterium]|nr:Zn-dependent hydrolase [Bacteroidales bacterium]
EILKILFEVSDIMDELFWKQAYGDKDNLLSNISDPYLKKYVEINYGPWDRMNNDSSFMENIGPKPKGANFYPVDMTKDEFNSLPVENKTSLYTKIDRSDENNLMVIPYHVAYKEELTKASDLLIKASELAEDEGFKNYLELRAKAIVTDDYQPSDMAWMDMKNNDIDFVVGAIENYEDQLFNYKAAYEAYILIKDKKWSERLEKFASLLPELQTKLPVHEKYKAEIPGSNSDLNAYDVIYYAGDCNAGGKTIAINLPNDEEVHLSKGSRRLQLKNAMQAKFDKIVVPISGLLIADEQQKHITFDAFFENVMFHEVAHGLGIKYTINGSDLSVGEALQDKNTI